MYVDLIKFYLPFYILGLLRDITGQYAYAYFAGGIIVMMFATLYLMYRYGNLICHCRKPKTSETQ